MNINYWSILLPVLILSSLGIFISPAWTETKRVDFTQSSRTNQTEQTSEINFTLKSRSEETFAALMEQAELLAASFLEQGFAESADTTEISVSILAEHNGQEAPLLFSRVSRSNWQKQPRIQQWTKYFSSSAVLLGFLKPKGQQPTAPIAESTYQQTTVPTSEGNSVQQTPAPTPAGNSVQQTPVPNSNRNSVQQIPSSVGTQNAAPSRDTSVPNRPDLEEGDSGIR